MLIDSLKLVKHHAQLNGYFQFSVLNIRHIVSCKSILLTFLITNFLIRKHTFSSLKKFLPILRTFIGEKKFLRVYAFIIIELLCFATFE